MVRLKREGLAALVRSETKRMTDGRWPPSWTCIITWRSPSSARKPSIACSQEAVYNVTKHARATWVRMRLTCESARCCCK